MAVNTDGRVNVSKAKQKGIVVVRSAADLASLRNSRRSKNLRILLELPGISPQKTAEWENGLNEHLRECGCSLGAKFAIGGLAFSIVYQAFVLGWQSGNVVWFLLRAGGFMFAGAGLGKLLGLAIAKHRIVRIERMIADSEGPNVMANG